MKNCWFLLLGFLVIASGHADTLYVSLNGSNISPFTSLETAATDIQSAVNTASPGDLVLIDNGHYMLSTPISIVQPIHLRAIGGGVIIDGNNSTRCFLLSDVACMLEGLIIRNGYVSGFAEEGGGVNCSGQSAVITNCIISNCSADAGGGVRGTTVFYSLLENNYAQTYGGAALEAVLVSCNVFNNEAESDGGGFDSSTAYNCIISGNSVVSAGGFGGGACSYDSFLYNCTVVNNYSAGNNGAMESGLAVNSIICYNNAAGTAQNISGSTSVSTSCCPDVVHGVNGNITNLPNFVDPLADFHLLAGSPCIDAGNNTAVLYMSDFGGDSRIINSKVDQGAYEFQFKASDTDGDGMSDVWELKYFGTIDVLPNEHHDADGFTAGDEYISDTDPTNSSSYYTVSNAVLDEFLVHWLSVSNREYSVFWSPSLTNSFEVVETGIEFPRGSFTNTSPNPVGFYKVDVKLK